MGLVKTCTCWSLVIAAVALAGCRSADSDDAELARAASSRLIFAAQWMAAIQDMGRFPVVPPTEDLYVGDVFAFATQPSSGPAKTVGGLRTVATPRWMSLPVLSQLEEEYRRRPTWNRTDDALRRDEPDDAAAGEADSLYRADRIPVRHRLVALRSMATMTIGVPDLEPFIPIEVAPLIEGPATSERFGISVQVGDAETYSLPLSTVIDEILVADEADHTKFALKPEQLRNLWLAADPKTGRAYLVVVTEVLYIRSIEVTIRRRYELLEAESPQAPAVPVDPWSLEPVPRTSSGLGAEYGDDPATAAIHRAQAMNEALNASGIEDGIGGVLQVVMATEDAFTLRRQWPYPLALAVRGLTFEVDVSTGAVERMGPLGVELLDLPPAPKPSAADEESSVSE